MREVGDDVYGANGDKKLGVERHRQENEENGYNAAFPLFVFQVRKYNDQKGQASDKVHEVRLQEQGVQHSTEHCHCLDGFWNLPHLNVAREDYKNAGSTHPGEIWLPQKYEDDRDCYRHQYPVEKKEVVRQCFGMLLDVFDHLQVVDGHQNTRDETQEELHVRNSEQPKVKGS